MIRVDSNNIAGYCLFLCNIIGFQKSEGTQMSAFWVILNLVTLGVIKYDESKILQPEIVVCCSTSVVIVGDMWSFFIVSLYGCHK